ncbi:MAG: TetR/AcrR family transcriptional regulator [Coriobacteriia bacterium]|nr:TetR/AcrR family transcriptional regulator [Coriobacteriia bacterium]
MSTRSEATIRRLFDAAMQLIGERGFTDASVDDIVERAGVAKGTVYYHFAGKADLVEALIVDRLRPLITEFRRAAEEHADDPRAAIEAIVRAELEFVSEQKSFSKLLLTEMWRENRVWRGTLVMLRSELGEVIHDVVVKGIASGVFRNDVDPSFAASALFGMTATVALDWLAFEPEKPLEDVLAQITRVAFNAIRPY